MRRAFWFSVAACQATAAMAADKPVLAPAAAWVKPARIPDANGPLGDTPTKVLLTDIQLHFDKDSSSSYVETAVRIQSPQGLAAMGTLAAQWQPDTDTLTVHKLHILRGKDVIDVLAKGSGFTILRRENNLELAALDGVLTATIQPEGLQVGDVVDMAYTLDRRDPLLKGHHDQLIAIPALPIGQLRVSAEWDPAVQMRIRPIDPATPPHTDRDAFLLAAKDVVPPVLPQGAPARYGWGRQVEFSDYGSWGDIAAQMQPLYAEARKLKPGSPLAAEIARIKALSPNPVRRAEAALALVQDQVRYVYLGMNQGNLRPAAADDTWLRRFGDCKAKTALLLALLDGLGIPAEAALVSVRSGDGLDQRLPMLSPFDHVIVRATIGGRTWWLDGTRMGDKSLARLQVPEFHWALPVHAGAKLERLVVPPLDHPVQTTDIRLDATAGITLPAKAHIETVFEGDAATVMRMSLANLSPADLDRGLRAYWTGEYDFMTPETVSARFDEATGTEHLTMDGTAKLDWNMKEQSAYYEVDGAALGWRPDYTRAPGPNADAPFAVSYPSYKLSRETILLPNDGAGFTVNGADVDQTIAGYHFQRRTKLDGKMLTMDASTRSLVPEISKEEADKSVEPLRALAKEGVYLYVPRTYRATTAENEAILSRPAKTVADYIDRARVRWRQQRLPDAITELNGAIALDPKAKTALAMRTAINAELNNRDAALADAERVLALDPHDPDALRVKVFYLRETDPKAAMAAADAAIAAQPNNAALRTNRAGLAFVERQYDRALADGAEAIRLDPTQIDAYLTRARIFDVQHKPELEATEADALVKANPGNAYAWAIAGSIYCRSNRKNDGFRAFDKSLAIQPNEVAYLTRTQYRPANDDAGRLSDIQAALKLDPHAPAALKMLLEMQRKAGDVAGQATTLATLSSIDPNDLDTAIHLAALHARKGEADSARQGFAAARVKAAKNAILLNSLCWEQATAGFDLDKALEDCKAAAALEPNRPAILDSLGFVLLRLRRYDESIAAYDAALKLAPEQGDSLYGRGIARKHKGDAAAAEADLKAARAGSKDIDDTFKSYGVTP